MPALRSDQEASLKQTKRRFLDTEFGQMHVRVGEPQERLARSLVCLHMSPQSGRSFSKFMSYAAADRLVIAPDYHGYGESDPPPTDQQVTIEDYARTVWQAIDRLGEEKVDLLGHHTGSKVAAEMAHQQPERVSSIVMASASICEPGELAAKGSKFDVIPLDEDGTRIRFFLNTINQLANGNTDKTYHYNFVAEVMRAGDLYQLGNIAADHYNSLFREVLGELQQPVWVLNPCDGLEQVTPKVIDYLAHGQLVDLPNWNLDFFDLHASEAAQLVTKLLGMALPEQTHLVGGLCQGNFSNPH